MRRRSLAFLLSVALLGSLLATTGAREEDFPLSKSGAENVPITRSDGTAGYMKSPDQKEVKKLVGYMRDGMNHADRLDKQRQYKRVIRTKK
jgi:hypothetical protein